MARLLAPALLVLLVVLPGCPDGSGDDDDDSVPPDGGPSLERLWPTAAHPGVQWPGCVYGSPLAWDERVVVIEGRGTLAVLDPETGEPDWTLDLPAPDGERPDVFATPVIVGDLLVTAYHTLDPEGDPSVNGERLRQRVAVVDLRARALAVDLPAVDLGARLPTWDGGEVEFLVTNALARATLVHLPGEGGALGRVVVTYGNARDIQPWHGWAFELDLDAWRGGGPDAAVSGVLVTTAETDCGTPGSSGSSERLCGGGLWAPSGPLVVPEGAGGFALILAPGNGHLDLARQAYANTLMRVGPGLAFDPGCDPASCADFDPDAPALDCIESCRDLFVPRVPDGQEPARPDSFLCDGLGMFECWAVLDYGGGSTPVRVELASGPVLLYPNKDGYVVLVDGEHLGTLHDRRKLADVCGTREHPCRANWAGMIVTQPALTELDGAPLAIVPTFMEDEVRPAAVVALRILDDPPRLEEVWRTPPADDPGAVQRFRLHPSRLALGRPTGGGQLGFLLERPADIHARGHLLVLDVATGVELADVTMTGPAQRFTLPLVLGDVVVVNSCDGDVGPGRLEAYRVAAGR